MAVFWVVPCSLVEVHQRVGEAVSGIDPRTLSQIYLGNRSSSESPFSRSGMYCVLRGRNLVSLYIIAFKCSVFSSVIAKKKACGSPLLDLLTMEWITNYRKLPSLLCRMIQNFMSQPPGAYSWGHSQPEMTQKHRTGSQQQLFIITRMVKKNNKRTGAFMRFFISKIIRNPQNDHS
jgi:hypothetical protein